MGGEWAIRSFIWFLSAVSPRCFVNISSVVYISCCWAREPRRFVSRRPRVCHSVRWRGNLGTASSPRNKWTLVSTTIRWKVLAKKKNLDEMFVLLFFLQATHQRRLLEASEASAWWAVNVPAVKKPRTVWERPEPSRWSDSENFLG